MTERPSVEKPIVGYSSPSYCRDARWGISSDVCWMDGWWYGSSAQERADVTSKTRERSSTGGYTEGGTGHRSSASSRAIDPRLASNCCSRACEVRCEWTRRREIKLQVSLSLSPHFASLSSFHLDGRADNECRNVYRDKGDRCGGTGETQEAARVDLDQEPSEVSLAVQIDGRNPPRRVVSRPPHVSVLESPNGGASILTLYHSPLSGSLSLCCQYARVSSSIPFSSLGVHSFLTIRDESTVSGTTR